MSVSVIDIQAPASKSVSHRALITAALAEGTSRLSNVLVSDDLRITRGCLEAGGVKIAGEGGELTVSGRPEGLSGGTDDPVVLEMHESGTSCRLLTGVAAAGKGRFRVQGAPRMHERPIGALAEALRAQGVGVEYQEKDGCPPLILDTKGLPGGRVEISLEESSQYLSGLLLAAPLAGSETVIEVVGRKAVSWPYAALTLQAMEDAGIDFTVEVSSSGAFRETDWRAIESVTPGGVRFIIRPGVYRAFDRNVEGDWSNASYFLAAGGLKNPVRVYGLRKDSVQGDKVIVDILETMGAKVEWDGDSVTVSPGKLKGATLDMGKCPDIVPTVAVFAAFCEGPTTITNVAHLRIKESDRLEVVAGNVAKAGAVTSLTEDSITIVPKPLAKGQSIEFATHGDHRMAMSSSIFELAGIDVQLDNPDCVAKSFPRFFEEWEKVRRSL